MATELEARPPSPNGQGPRTPAQIEADIEATRLHMAATVDAIAERVSPKNVAHRTVDSLKAQVVDPDGTPKIKRLLAGSIALTAIVGIVVWRKRH